MMEDTKLNFDQPLLSVRRHGPPATSRRTERRKIYKSHPLIPRLPFHRSELKSGPITNPGSVPFTWEQSPGQPKEETRPHSQNCDKPPIAPRLPPGRYVKADAQDCRKVSPNAVGCNNQAVSSPRSSDNERQDVYVPHDESVQNMERSNEAAEEKESSDSGDSDGAYVDALDTLSRAESSFLNCSMSGISGLGELNVKPSGNFSTDVQAREFMMDRFLPAAKAMASETPQYAPKKHPVVQQQPQQVKKTVDQHKPLLRYGPSFAARYSHYQESEEEESDDDYDQHQNMSGVCGLLPRFCLKNSLGRLNPVPGMSVRTRVPISSAKKVQPRSSSGGSFSETEFGSGRMEIKSMDKFQTYELEKESAASRNESGHLESHSSSAHCGSSPPFLEEKEVLSVSEENGKGLKTFQELLEDQESNSVEPVEKTLYVDTEQKVESPNFKSFSPKTRDTKVVPSLREDDHEIITKMIDLDSSLRDFNKLNTIEGDNKSIQKPGMEMPQGFGENRDFSLVLTTREFTQVTVTEQEMRESSEKQLSQAVTLENSHQNYSGLPGPPPLPKSPSDSWLCRTLPSMPGKSSSLRLYLGGATNLEKQCKKEATSDMKWETIVKSTKVQRRHLHYSEEMLMTIPET